MPAVELLGISWNHSRAYPPLVATAQRYEELHPGIVIRWDKRTLDEFGHQAIDTLAARYDLIVIDHPWAGYSLEHHLVLDLAPLVTPAVREALERGAVGESFRSYLYEGRLLALPIDAATPVASWRPDLLVRAGVSVPSAWSEVVALARRGLAVIPAFAPDLFLHFLMLCHALGGRPCDTPERLAEPDAARTALEMLHDLTASMPPAIYEWNPVLLAEAMTTRGDLAYAAFAYSYHNYARPEFAAQPLRFGPLVGLDRGPRLRGILGGTGIAIARRCAHPDVALDYAIFTASAEVQRTLYFSAGGQPAHCKAWDDATVNALSGNFFHDTRSTQDEAIVRPRFCGYVPLQHEAGRVLQTCLRHEADDIATLEAIDRLYRASRARGRICVSL